MRDVIKFSKKIYPLRAVKIAVKHYQEAADCQIKQVKGYILVSFKNKTGENDSFVRHEFCNYVLAMVKA